MFFCVRGVFVKDIHFFCFSIKNVLTSRRQSAVRTRGGHRARGALRASPAPRHYERTNERTNERTSERVRVRVRVHSRACASARGTGSAHRLTHERRQLVDRVRDFVLLARAIPTVQTFRARLFNANKMRILTCEILVGVVMDSLL